jgi:hypothetical protein
MANSRNRRTLRRLLERLGAEQQSMPKPSPEQISIARKKSKRQLALDVAAIAGTCYAWWSLMAPNEGANLFFGLLFFPLFLFCLWCLLDDIWPTHKRGKLTVFFAMLICLLIVECGKIYNRIYRPDFPFATLAIGPPNEPPYVLTPPLRFTLNLFTSQTHSIENVSVGLTDVSDIPEGGNATEAIAKARYGYVPIIYPFFANGTNIDLSCTGYKIYSIDMETKIGMFHETMRCNNEDISSQMISVESILPRPFWAKQKLIDNWKPRPIERTLSGWFLDLCD